MAPTGCAPSKWTSKKSIENGLVVNKEMYCGGIQERAPKLDRLPHRSLAAWEIAFFFKAYAYVLFFYTGGCTWSAQPHFQVIELQKLKEKTSKKNPHAFVLQHDCLVHNS